MTSSHHVSRHLPGGMELLYEDQDILVVNKPAGLLTISTEKERQRTAYYILTDYVRKGNSRSRYRIFIVHRLDKDTSGVLVVAKTGPAKRQLQGEWESTKKRYLAIVQGTLEKKTDTLSSYLAENEAGFIYSTNSVARGKLSHTAYAVKSEQKDLTLLEIELLTGRKHQIRVHLSDIGHPVAGDKKYNKVKDGFPRLALHAWYITFAHPHTGEWMEFTAKPPSHFSRFAAAIKDNDRPIPITPAPRATSLPLKTPAPPKNQTARPQTGTTDRPKLSPRPGSAPARPPHAPYGRPDSGSVRPKAVSGHPATSSRPKSAPGRPGSGTVRPKAASGHPGAPSRPKSASGHPSAATPKPKSASGRPGGSSSRPKTSSGRPKSSPTRPGGKPRR